MRVLFSGGDAGILTNDRVNFLKKRFGLIAARDLFMPSGVHRYHVVGLCSGFLPSGRQGVVGRIRDPIRNVDATGLAGSGTFKRVTYVRRTLPFGSKTATLWGAIGSLVNNTFKSISGGNDD